MHDGEEIDDERRSAHLRRRRSLRDDGLMAIILVLQLMQAAAGTSSMHHLHLFMHDGYTGHRPTAVLIVNGTGAPVISGVRFGDTVVMDDVLTEGPSRASRPVGRAQGTYVTASLEKGRPAMLLSMNVVLTDYDGYTGSTVAVMGRNDITAPVRELAVVGGTGRFRMATGYVLWKTASWKGKNAVLELDIYLRVVDD